MKSVNIPKFGCSRWIVTLRPRKIFKQNVNNGEIHNIVICYIYTVHRHTQNVSNHVQRAFYRKLIDTSCLLKEKVCLFVIFPFQATTQVGIFIVSFEILNVPMYVIIGQYLKRKLLLKNFILLYHNLGLGQKQKWSVVVYWLHLLLYNIRHFLPSFAYLDLSIGFQPFQKLCLCYVSTKCFTPSNAYIFWYDCKFLHIGHSSTSYFITQYLPVSPFKSPNNWTLLLHPCRWCEVRNS